MKYTSMDRIFSKLGRDLSNDIVNENDIIEWTGEALEFINAIRSKEEAVAFLTVTNYQCEIPYNLHNIIQIAKNEKVDVITPASATSITEDTEEVVGETTDYPVCLDCNGAPLNDYNVAYYRPYYDAQQEYFNWQNSNSYQRCYVPVKLTNHSFFNSIVCSQENGCDVANDNITINGLINKESYEYTVIEGKILRFNFEKGLVALAYLRNVTDIDGIPMIPDDISFITAIIAYVTMKIQTREFYNGREGSTGRMTHAEKQWAWYCKQSSTKSLMPQGVDEMENLVNQMKYIIPRRNAYDNYFGNLNNRETKNLLHTRSRNNSYYGR